MPQNERIRKILILIQKVAVEIAIKISKIFQDLHFSSINVKSGTVFQMAIKHG
jgi:hypothetical protein